MITYAKHEEEFYGVVKLSSGEELLAKIILTEEEGETLAFMQDPVGIQVINKAVDENKMMKAMGFHKWMQLSDEEFFIIREKDIIAVASMSKEVVLMYETFLTSNDIKLDNNEVRTKRRTQIDNVKGFLGKVDQARALFEKIYNN